MLDDRRYRCVVRQAPLFCSMILLRSSLDHCPRCTVLPRGMFLSRPQPSARPRNSRHLCRACFVPPSHPGHVSGRQRIHDAEPCQLNMPPSAGAGRCWYSAANDHEPAPWRLIAAFPRRIALDTAPFPTAWIAGRFPRQRRQIDDFPIRRVLTCQRCARLDRPRASAS